MTYIGTKRGLIEFLERNIKDDEAVVSTNGLIIAEAFKTKGLKATFEYGKDTFAQEKGISNLWDGKNIAICIVPKSSLSASSKELFKKDGEEVKKSKTSRKITKRR